MTVAEALAVALPVLESLATLVIDRLPFGEHVTEIVLVVDVPVHPVGRVHVYVYGDVPPVVVAVHVNAVPAIWPVPQPTEFVSAWAPTVAVAEPVPVTVLESLAVLLIE